MGLCTCPAVCRNKRKRWRRAAPGQNKNSGRSIDPPLLAHTPAFSSRQTVFGKQPIFLGAQKHAHGHHTHAHLAHHHSRAATLHAAFLLTVFCRSWAHHNAFAVKCQPFFLVSAFSLKKPTHAVGVFVPSAMPQLSGCRNHKMVYNVMQ